MAIQPLSDIILDVANAADPARAQAVKQKLSELGDGLPAGSFDDVLSSSGTATSTRWSSIAEAQFFSARTGPAIKQQGSMDEARRGLETMVVKLMVENMLPKEGNEFYGKGNAGGVWRSMLADKLSAELTKGKGFGILRGVQLGKG